MKKIKNLINRVRGLFCLLHIFSIVNDLTDSQKKYLLHICNNYKNKKINVNEFSIKIIDLKKEIKNK